MVRMYRVPGEFSIADVRESFMRQFIDQENDLDLEIDSPETREESDSCQKLSPLHLVKSPAQGGTRSGGVVEKKAGVTSILRSGKGE